MMNKETKMTLIRTIMVLISCASIMSCSLFYPHFERTCLNGINWMSDSEALVLFGVARWRTTYTITSEDKDVYYSKPEIWKVNVDTGEKSKIWVPAELHGDLGHELMRIYGNWVYLTSSEETGIIDLNTNQVVAYMDYGFGFGCQYDDSSKIIGVENGEICIVDIFTLEKTSIDRIGGNELISFFYNKESGAYVLVYNFDNEIIQKYKNLKTGEEIIRSVIINDGINRINVTSMSGTGDSELIAYEYINSGESDRGFLLIDKYSDIEINAITETYLWYPVSGNINTGYFVGAVQNNEENTCIRVFNNDSSIKTSFYISNVNE